MIKQVQQYKERFEALSLRERGLVLFAVLAVMYIGWDLLLMQNMYKKQELVLTQVGKWRGQISDVDRRIQSVAASMNDNAQQQAKKRLEDLKFRLNKINQRQKAMAVSFIRPQQMVEVLKGLLIQEKGLKLTRLQTVAVTPLFAPSIDPVAESDKKIRQALDKPPIESESSETNQPTIKLPEIFKHGLEIEFKGNYSSTLSYLQKLEALPWRFYWDEVSYEVLEYPKAQITVKIHTLSLDKGWISV